MNLPIWAVGPRNKKWPRRGGKGANNHVAPRQKKCSSRRRPGRFELFTGVSSATEHVSGDSGASFAASCAAICEQRRAGPSSVGSGEGDREEQVDAFEAGGLFRMFGRMANQDAVRARISPG